MKKKMIYVKDGNSCLFNKIPHFYILIFSVIFSSSSSSSSYYYYYYLKLISVCLIQFVSDIKRTFRNFMNNTGNPQMSKTWL